MLSLINQVVGRPWAIHGDIAMHVQGLLAREGLGGLRHLAEIKAAVHAFDQARETRRRESRPPGIAVISVMGTMTLHGDIVNSAQTRSTAEIAHEVSMAAADAGVGSLLLNFDSPGGEVFGVPEAWQAVRAAAAKKPVVASINAMAASAAYYLASAASESWLTPSGVVGSIGVYALHVDMSKALADAGEKWTFVSAGKYKVEGNASEPLTDSARSNLQQEVDAYYGMFVRDVARGRGVPLATVLSDFGQGRMLMAKAALSVGMVDAVGTFGQALQRAGDLARSPSLARSPQLRLQASQEEARIKLDLMAAADSREVDLRAIAARRLRNNL